MQPDRTTPAPVQGDDHVPAGLAIGLDIGGTKIAAGIVSAVGEMSDYQVRPTPAGDAPAVVAVIRQAVAGLRERHPGVSAVGAGVGAWVEWPAGTVRYAPYIGLQNLPLRQLLQDETGLPAVVDNDANMAAWAESQFGAGKGSTPLLLLTLGTGIGGGLVIDGELYRGSNSLGAEVGHLMLKPGGERCGCGNLGCFEAMASGTALGRAARQAARAGDSDGGEAVTGESVTRAAARGDQAARALLDEVGYWCGVGTASLVNILDPAMIVITGGMAAAGELLLAPMRASLAQHIYAREHRSPPPVVISTLGAGAGLIGAGSLALHMRATCPA